MQLKKPAAKVLLQVPNQRHGKVPERAAGVAPLLGALQGAQKIAFLMVFLQLAQMYVGRLARRPKELVKFVNFYRDKSTHFDYFELFVLYCLSLSRENNYFDYFEQGHVHGARCRCVAPDQVR